MISEGLWDTEDWSNGRWKFSFAITEINHILENITIETVLYCNDTVFHNITVYCGFDQIIIKKIILPHRCVYHWASEQLSYSS